MDTTDRPSTIAAVGQRPCAWCAATFVVIRRPGRPRLYCNHACRQRAYEHRHGFRHERTVRPLPGQASGDRWTGTGYEEGRCPTIDGKLHAMRTSVRPEGRRRETLCGLLAFPVPGRHFSVARSQSCLSCAEVTRRNPLRFGVTPSNELSRLRALLAEGFEERVEPDDLSRWLRTRLAR